MLQKNAASATLTLMSSVKSSTAPMESNLVIPTRTRYAAFAGVGLTILLAATLAEPSLSKSFRDALQSIGLVILSVVILDIMWNVAGGNPVERKFTEIAQQIERLEKAISVVEASKRVGLVDVRDRAGNFGGMDDWMRLISNARQSIDLMGRTLHGWTNATDLDALITRKIMADNINFRWLIMSRENEHLPRLEEDGREISQQIAEKIPLVCKRLESIRESLPDDKKGNLEVRLFVRVPLYCSYVRVDDRFFITNYLQSVGSGASPLLILQDTNAPWPNAYAREFEMVWKSAQRL